MEKLIRYTLLFVMGSCCHLPVVNSQALPQAQHYGAEEGVPQSFVTAVFQDKAGIVWIGTGKGLAFFDGHRFQSIIPRNNDSVDLQNVLINRVMPEKEGRYFIHYQSQGWRIFDPLQRSLQPVSYPEFPELQVSKGTNAMHWDSRGRLWVKEKKNVCKVYIPGRKPVMLDSAHGFAVEMLMGITETPDKQALLLVTDKGVYEAVGDPQQMTLVPFKIKRHFIFYQSNYPLLWANDHELLIGEKGRILRYDQASHQIVPGISWDTAFAKKPVEHLVKTRDGTVLAEIDRAIFSLKDKLPQLLWQSTALAQQESEIRSMMLDQSGLLWAGINANGVYAIQPGSAPVERFASKRNFALDILQYLPGFPKERPSSYSNDVTWKHVLRWHYLSDTSFVLSAGLQQKETFGPYLYTGSGWRLLPTRQPEKLHFAAFTHSGDTLFGITSQGGLYTWQPAHSASSFGYSDPFGGKAIAVLGMQRYQGQLMLATETSGLYLLDVNGKLKRLGAEIVKGAGSPIEKLSSITGMTIDPSKPGLAYLSTSTMGLLRWDMEKQLLDTVTLGEDMTKFVLFDVLADQQGRFWLATNSGLAVYDPVIRRCFRPAASMGWPAYEFNRGEAFRFPDGKLAFGGTEGWAMVDPSGYRPDTASIGVAFTGLSVNGKPRGFAEGWRWAGSANGQGERIELGPNENYLRISFTGTRYDAHDLISYRYRLLGQQDEWVSNGQESVINFAGLSPGNYSLELQAKMPGTLWEDAGSSVLAFHIMAPWWQRWWAWLLYVLVVLALVSWYFMNQRRQMKLSLALQQEQMHANQLAEFNAVRTRFFDNITHDLRTPLTLILTPASSLVSYKNLDEQPRHYASIIQRQAGRLLHLVNEMLDLAKIQAGEMKINNAITDLRQFNTELLEAFLPKANEKSLQLSMILPGDMPHIKTDAEKLRRIAENLLSNAIKFTPAGGRVSLHFTMQQETGNEATLQMEVKDTGAGIPQHELGEIFNRFYQRNDKQQGTGIGLSLVKELTALMGGSVSLQSEPGRGTVFTVSVPVEVLHEAERVGQEADIFPMPDYLPEVVSGQPTVLLVEDHPDLRDFLSQQLAMHYRVLVASGGHEAWQIVQEELPDLVVSDWMMEQGDGLELCQNIKSHEATRHISVILLTAKAAADSRIKGLEAGADDYLPKPFVWEELELRLANQLRQQQQLREYLRRQWLQEVPSQTIVRPEDAFVQRLHQYMENEYAGEVDVEKLAQHASMSRRTLHRKLTSVLGMSPVEYIQHFRLQKSLPLLKAGYTVSEVAYSVGFESPAYFSKCFKEVFGDTPTAFSAS